MVAIAPRIKVIAGNKSFRLIMTTLKLLAWDKEPQLLVEE